jgi:hemolysin activation/secretion protein
MACCAITALAQPVPPPASSAEQEQRRSQERYRSQRQQLEPRPDVRLTPAPASQGSLPAEPNCFVINQLGIKAVSGEQPQLAARFGWVIDSLAEPDQNGLPIMRRCVGPAGVSLLLKRAQDALVARGYVTSRIVAEPQDLSEGEFTLTLMPGRINAIRFAPGSSPRGTLWNAVPAKPGDILNLRDIEQALENFKRIPTAEADIQIEPAVGQNAKPNQSDLVIRYQQVLPFRVSLSLDDSGSKATGKYQGSLTTTADNALTLNDLFYVTASRDLGGGTDLNRGTYGNTVHYSVPLGYWLLAATGSRSSYRQTVAGINQNYVYWGQSSNLDVKLSRLVYRDATRKTTLGIKAFQRTSSNFIDDTEIMLQKRIVGGFELSANHREFIGSSTLDANLAYKRGTGAFGSLPAPEAALGEGTSRMQLAVFDATLNAPFKALGQNFRYTGTFRGQANQTRLTPQDRFAIGGRYSVRGFDGETSLSAERGWLMRNDLALALGASGQELYVGIDYGELGGPSSDLMVGKSLSGAVLGLRGGHKAMRYDLFIGQPISKPNGFRAASYTVGVSLNVSF